ncbi:MAG: competence protein TfoX [Eubacterium sp.]|nr:competence protein TfoX [Eubacterium sp.]
MASTKDYLDFVLEQLSGLDEVTFRAMMGEYTLYYRGRVFAGSRTGSNQPKGVIKESGIAAHASVRGQNMLAGVPDVVLTNDCLKQ